VFIPVKPFLPGANVINFYGQNLRIFFKKA
jgi:hypothetical protein